MKNPIADSQNGVLVQCLKAEDGATEYGDEINLKHFTAAVLATFRLAFTAARDALKLGQQALRDKRAVVTSVTATAREFATNVRDVLKKPLGRKYSQKWNAVGFTKNLQVPTDPDDVLALLSHLVTYLTANPSLQVDTLNLTAVEAQSLFDSLRLAISGVNDQKTAVGTLMEVRDAKMSDLRKALRGLLKELGSLLGPLDARWLAFGFNQPGADTTPDVPTNLRVVLNGTNATLAWDASPRAQHYRLWKKVVGVDEHMVAVDHRTDLMFVFGDLPANSTIQLAASAVNDGGESALSEPVTVTTH